MNDELSERQAADDEMLPEYDFSGGVRGKHYQAIIHKADGTTEVQDFALPEGAGGLDPETTALLHLWWGLWRGRFCMGPARRLG